MIRIELFKIFRKKEFSVLMFTLLLPLAFAFLIYAGAVKSSDVSSGPLALPGLMAVTFGFFEQLGALGIIAGIMAVSTLSSEIDNHNVLLYFPRLISRKKLYVNKVLALTIAFTVWSALFLLVCAIAYFFLTYSGSAEVSGQISDISTPAWLSSMLATYVYLLFIINATLLIGAFCKPMVSILALLGILFGSILLHPLPIVGNLLPIHYMQVAMNHLNTVADIPIVILNYTISIMMSLVYIVIFAILGRRKIARLEV
ncbi:MAG: hypothetical protein LBR74_02170 [Eubacterium sp.]|jgi:ABC-type transport system involved in multi-copper enzyme maturation permease subunit|nr:hypothetical protein [Eubacterium sp.]